MNFAIYSTEEANILIKQWSFQEWPGPSKNLKVYLFNFSFVFYIVLHYSIQEVWVESTKDKSFGKKKTQPLK